jgi:nucleotidyltransferase/DNA polymerase involved in DNA repair
MKKDDLTQLKHIGPSRMKVLNDKGITTIKKLYETPPEKLAEIESIGQHYAKLIKDAVTEYYGKEHQKLAPKAVSAEDKKIEENNQNLGKQIKILNKRLQRVNENLKPLWKKKYLELYIDFKKRTKTLKSRLRDLEQAEKDLPKKVKKTIIKKTNSLNSTLKNIGKKPKKKKYKELAKEIQSFSKMLRNAGA